MQTVANFDIDGQRKDGDAVKINTKTVWVRVPKRKKLEDGTFENIPHQYVSVKRHTTKHNVILRSE